MDTEDRDVTSETHETSDGTATGWSRRRFLGASAALAGASAVAAGLPAAAVAQDGDLADFEDSAEGHRNRRPVMVDTVRGAISPDSIGGVLAHEHLFVDFWGPLDPNYLNPINGFEAAVDVIEPYVRDVQDLGVELIVDWGPLGVGRSVDTARAVSERTGVHVAIPSGIYKNLRPAEFVNASVDDLTDFVIREFSRGIDDTGVKPAFIKIAASPVPAAGEVDIHRACAQAAAATGATLACHLPFPIDARTGTETARARQVFDIAVSHGVSPDRFVWGHASGIIKAEQVEPADLDASVMQHFELAAEGVTIQFDAVGSDPANGPEPFFGGPTDPEVFLTLLEQFVNLGYGDRVMISNDASVYVNPGGGPAGEHAADYTAAGLPVWQYARDIRYLHGTLEALMVARLGEPATAQILRDTPLRVFSRRRRGRID